MRGYITPWDAKAQRYGDAYLDIVGLPPAGRTFTIRQGEGFWVWINTASNYAY